MTDSLKNAANKMAVVSQWEKDEASIASLANHGSADISVGLDSGSIWLLDHNLNQKAEALSDQKFPIIDHFWTQKNQVCYTQGKNIVLFDAEKQKVVTSFIGHTDYVLNLKKNKHENYFVSAGDDKSVMIWDIKTGKPINYILAHSSSITSVDIFEDSSVILTTSDEGYSRLWDVHNGECLRTAILSNSPPLSQGKFTRTSDIALFSSLNSKISLFNIRAGKLIREYHGHSNNEYLVDVLLTSNTRGDIDGFVTGSENGIIHRFSLLEETPVDSLGVCSDGQTLDLLLFSGSSLYVSGRAWQSVFKITLPAAH